jgi:hypothetical protein
MYPRTRGSGATLARHFNAPRTTISNVRNDPRYYLEREVGVGDNTLPNCAHGRTDKSVQ